MIESCGKSIALPLKLLFKAILEERTFPEDWKKSNVVPIHKKKSKNLIKNYRPISLLPIFSVNLVLFEETPVLLNYY